MQSTSVPPWHSCFYYPIPKHFFSQQQNLKFTIKRTLRSSFANSQNTHFTHCSVPSLLSATANSCSKEQEQTQRNLYTHKTSPQRNQQKPESFTYLDSSGESRDTHLRDDEDDDEGGIENRVGILSNMWWAEVKAALGQRVNVEGLVSSVGILTKDRHLVIPHVSVPDVRHIDWSELKKRGFQGVVFDKDNTLTIPYSLSLWGPLASSVEQCKSLFGNNVAVFSNSAGLYEYDPDGKKAKALENAIGIEVIRHRLKKPAGTAEEVERQFGCESSRLIMVGDRPFTDIAFGNKNGFLTILTEPLSVAEEPFIVKQVRILELALVNRWSRKGVMATSHSLLPQPKQCVKGQPR